MLRLWPILIMFLSLYCSFSGDEDLSRWEILETERDFTIEQVKNLPSTDWKQVKLPVVPGFSQSAFWLRTKLDDLDTDTYYLVNPAAYVERVDFRHIRSDEINSLHAGSVFPRIDEKYKRFPYPLFKFSHDRQSESWIYLKFTSDSSIYMEPLVFDAEALGDVYSDLQIFHLVFFAVLGFVFLFNLSQYLRTRNNTFLYYIFHILAVMLYQLAYTGLGKVFFWNEYPEWNRRSLVVLGSLSFFAISLFTIRFFQMERKSIRIYRLLMILLTVIGFNAVLGLFIPVSIADPMTHVICSLTAFILLGACINISGKGLGFVKFYLVAISFLIISIIGFNLFAFGILPWDFMRFSIEIGTFAEIIVFNLAIWDKFAQLERGSKFEAHYSEPGEINSNSSASLDSLLGSIEERDKQSGTDRTSGLDRSKVLQQIRELIQEKIYCDEDLGLNRMAAILDIRPDQLSALVNKEYQLNFNQFINKHRIDHAKQLLLSQVERSILNIAFESGFNSKSTFNNEFRKNTGKTPSEFRSKAAVSIE